MGTIILGYLITTRTPLPISKARSLSSPWMLKCMHIQGTEIAEASTQRGATEACFLHAEGSVTRQTTAEIAEGTGR